MDENVLLLILQYLEARDLGRCAMVCKTWRRLSLKEVLWERFAVELQLKNEGTSREAVAAYFDSFMRKDFVFLPEGIDVENCGDVEVTILVMALWTSMERHCGKKVLVDSFTYGKYVDCFGLSRHENEYRKVQPVLDDTGEKIGKTIYHITPFTQPEGFSSLEDQYFRESPEHLCVLLCSTFSRPECLQEIQLTVDRLLRSREECPLSLILVRTKSDLGLPMVHKQRILAWCKANQIPFVSCSSKEYINVQLSFRYCAVMHQNRLNKSRKEKSKKR